MPRLNSGLEVVKQLDSLKKYSLATGTPGDTTLSTAATTGVATVPVTAITNFTNGDPVFIVSSLGFELNKINGAPNTTMPVQYKVALAHESGSRFVEAQEIALGHLDEGTGVTFGGTLTIQAVLSAVARTPIAYLRGQGEFTMSFGLRGFNLLNLQTAFGIDEVETGAGTSGDPYQVVLGQTNVGTHGLQCYRAQATRVDGKTVLMDFNDATIEVNANTPIGTATPPVLPVTLRCTTIIARIW